MAHVVIGEPVPTSPEHALEPMGRAFTMGLPTTVAAETAPSRASIERPIDLVHLARMTLGDRGLEREVLALFDRQATVLLSRLRASPPGAVTSVAHTLKGSARGVGAWRVANAAEAVERAASAGEADLSAAITTLAAVAEEARAVIAELLRAN
jgi:HPt (histidine-containing phosphotransfer) domain-containing protein